MPGMGRSRVLVRPKENIWNCPNSKLKCLTFIYCKFIILTCIIDLEALIYCSLFNYCVSRKKEHHCCFGVSSLYDCSEQGQLIISDGIISKIVSQKQ